MKTKGSDDYSPAFSHELAVSLRNERSPAAGGPTDVGMINVQDPASQMCGTLLGKYD